MLSSAGIEIVWDLFLISIYSVYSTSVTSLLKLSRNSERGKNFFSFLLISNYIFGCKRMRLHWFFLWPGHQSLRIQFFIPEMQCFFNMSICNVNKLDNLKGNNPQDLKRCMFS